MNATSDTKILERLDQVCDTLLELNPLKCKDLLSLLIVVVENLALVWEFAALDIRLRQSILELRELVPHYICDLTVREPPTRGEESLASGARFLETANVCARGVSDIDPQRHGHTRGDFILPASTQQADYSLVGGVDAIERCKMVHDRPEHDRGAHCDQVETGLFVLNKIPGGTLGESL